MPNHEAYVAIRISMYAVHVCTKRSRAPCLQLQLVSKLQEHLLRQNKQPSSLLSLFAAYDRDGSGAIDFEV